MKLDMHCHVKEGSIDSKVSLDEYITILKEKGFDGMLITDHDTYKGYRHWKYQMKGKVHEDFVVLKGIEYDTCDAGHIICIMPEGVKMRLLELRGCRCSADRFRPPARRDPGTGPSAGEVFKFHQHQEILQITGDHQAV
mgnify:CR=1 FL=1